MEVIAARTMNALYMYLDVAFLLFLGATLVYTKRYLTILVGLLAGILYFIVDYGYFYLYLGTRSVEGADPFCFLLWLSMSYGFTNFVWIWLWLDRDKRALEWSILIIASWFTTSLLSQSFGGNFAPITISRGTGAYHGIMALILFVGYAILCIHNIRTTDETRKINIPWILAIGILVQFAWEFVLLVTGIRNPSFMTIVVNSLLETNLGLPYMYLIHRAVSKRYHENLSRREKIIVA